MNNPKTQKHVLVEHPNKNPEMVDYEDDAPNTTVSTWSWVSAFLLFLLASCLILFPRFLLFISEIASPGERRSALTSLESFLALHFGIWLATTACALIFNIPSSSAISVAQKSRTTVDHPLLKPLTTASIIAAFLSYNTSNIGPLALSVCFGSSIIGLWGLWIIIFGDASSLSKKTGADKHTSSFLFGNKNAASIRKKQWMKEHE